MTLRHPLEELEAVRRLDWRFLFPRPEFGDVAWLGRSNPQVEESLRLVSTSVTVIDPSRAVPDDGRRFDLVVVRNPAKATVERSVELLRPHGRLYIELSRGWARGLRPGRSLSRLVTALARDGQDSVEAYWHFPNLARPYGIVALSQLGAVRHVLERAEHSVAARARRWLGHRLLKAGRFELAVTDVSLVAGRRDGSEAEGQHMIELFLMQNAARLDLGRYGLSESSESVLLTPQDQSSKCVVFLVMAKGGSPPVLAVKLPRLARFGDRLVQEAANLQAVQRLRRQGFDTIPRLVACEESDGRPVLVQTALAGEVLDPGAVRRDEQRTVTAVLAWLEDVWTPTLALADSGWYERLIELPLQRFEQSLPEHDDVLGLVSSTRRLLEPLRSAHLPSTLEHGDLSYPNIIQLEDGRIGVVDWELAELEGVPTHDLFFFLTFIAFARSRADRLHTRLEAFDAAFVAPGAWAKRYVADYARRTGIDPVLLTPLLVACWARYTVGLLPRVGEPEKRAGTGTSVGSTYIERSWYRALWQHAVANASRLDWRDGSW